MTEDEDVLVSAAEAAEEIGMSPSTIDTWRRRGYLAPAGRRGRWVLYRLSDVLTCEADRKREHRRKDHR